MMNAAQGGGAHVGYAELNQHPPRDPVRFDPVIHRGVCNPPAADNPVFPAADGRPNDFLPPVYLKREDNDGAAAEPHHAYARLPDHQPIVLNHAPDWGQIIFGVIYRAVDNGYQAPTQIEAVYVAIKRLNKAVVRDYLDRGGRENPLIEIHRMQELGDDVHVLRCIEALEDETYWYIITRRACAMGTLADQIPWDTLRWMDPNLVVSWFVQILEILCYLERRGICHHDLKPQNLLFLSPDRLVAIDLAMSVRIPSNEDGGTTRRALIKPQGSFGTLPWMAPEIANNHIFDGVGVDLWAAAVILYNLLTTMYLYEIPHPADYFFRFNVLAGGIWSDPREEGSLAGEVWNEVFQEQQFVDEHNRELIDQIRTRIVAQANANLRLSDAAAQLLQHVLQVSPLQRWSLGQVTESAFVVQNGPQQQQQQQLGA